MLCMLFLFIGAAFSLSSTSGVFEVKPSYVELNWSYAEGEFYEANITIYWNSTTSGKVEILNTSTELCANYTQICFSNVLFSFPDNVTALLNETNTTTVKIALNTTPLFPGKYCTKLVFMDNSNTSENLTLPVCAEIPFKLNKRSAITSVKYIIKPNTTVQDAHVFYFNTSSVKWLYLKVNSTAPVMIFIEGNETKAESFYSRSPELFVKTQDEMEKVIVYANSTQEINYTIFTAISQLAIYSEGKEVNKISLGEFNSTRSSANTVFVLNNTGNFTYENITQDTSIFRVQEFRGNSSKIIEFIVSPFASKVEALVKWNGTEPSVEFVSPSGESYSSATNTTNYSELFGYENVKLFVLANKAGKWYANITLSGSANYTLEIKEFISSDWFLTNFSETTINETGSNGSYVWINASLSLPTLFYGNYTVQAKYSSSSLPIALASFEFTQRSPVIILNNSFYGKSVYLDAILGRTKLFKLNFSIENSGNENASVKVQVSQPSLSSRSVQTKVYFNGNTVSDTLLLQAFSKANLTVELNLSSITMPGIYKGYVLLNLTNTTNFAKLLWINITLNVSNELITRYARLSKTIIKPGENVTLYFNATYANGTLFNETMYIENISCISLYHKNLSYSTTCLSKSYYSGSNVMQSNPKTALYAFNFTVPQTILGGVYSLKFNYTSADGKLVGEGSQTILVEGSALVLNIISSPSEMANGTTEEVKIKIDNFGLNNTPFAIEIVPDSVIQSSSFVNADGCSYSSASGWVYNFSGFNSGNTSCIITFYVTAVSSAASGKVYFKGYGGKWFRNQVYFALSVIVPKITSNTQESNSQTENYETQETNQTNVSSQEENITKDIKILFSPSKLSIAQGEKLKTTLEVKNAGNVKLNISFLIFGIPPSWYSLLPKFVETEPGEKVKFSVEFRIPKDVKPEKKHIFFVFKAEGVEKNTSMILEILPSNETLKKLKEEIEKLREEYINISSSFAEMLQKLENKGNFSNVNTLLEKADAKLSEAEKLLKKGSYEEAKRLVEGAKTLLSEAKGLIGEAEVSKESTKTAASSLPILWLLLGAGGIALLIYLLHPPKHGYEPRKGYRFVHPRHRGKPRIKILKEHIHECLECIREKIKKLKGKKKTY